MDLSFLPAVNATLNGIAAVLIVIGLVLIKQKRIDAHRKCMIAAFSTSCIFLVTYLTHYGWRAAVKGGTHTKFEGVGVLKAIYYPMLFSHILLAMAVPVLAVLMIRYGLKRQDDKHRKLARYAVPIWLYVSVTGVLIYVMLYHLNPAAG
jgi:uncharacterized membrane protein YozB (DUF420 family)